MCIYVYICIYMYILIHILMNICTFKLIIKTHVYLPEPIGIETESIQRGRQFHTRALRATHITKEGIIYIYTYVYKYTYVYTCVIYIYIYHTQIFIYT